MAAVDAIDDYLAGEPGLRARRLAPGEWGITVPAEVLEADGLDVGIRVADGLVRAQAMALAGSPRGGPLDAAVVEPPDPASCASRARAGATSGCTRTCRWPRWTSARVDRLLGLVVEGALAVRGLRRP